MFDGEQRKVTVVEEKEISEDEVPDFVKMANRQGEADSLHYACPHCGKPFSVDEASDEYLVPCPGCGTQLDLTELLFAEPVEKDKENGRTRIFREDVAPPDAKEVWEAISSPTGPAPHPAPDRMKIEGKVVDIIVDKLGVSKERVKPEASLIEDLGADSIDVVDLVMTFEEEFGGSIPDEDSQNLKTVGDIISYIENRTVPESSVHHVEDDSIRYACPHCGKPFSVDESSDEYLVPCPGCGKRLDLTELNPL